jgi:metal-sulfur cluster biosynthetic enzyme
MESDNMIKEKNVIEKLKEVQDPELGIDVYTLGLIYKITIDKEGVEVLMTLTTPLCPFANELVTEVENKLAELYEGSSKRSEAEDGNVRVEITFNPPWEPSEQLRSILGV